MNWKDVFFYKTESTYLNNAAHLDTVKYIRRWAGAITTRKRFIGRFFVMKKLFAVCIIGLAFGVTGVFAQHPGGLGIGVQGGWSGGGGGALSLKVASLPIFWAINVGPLESGGSGDYKWSSIGFGVTGDYYLFDQALPVPGLGWYLGLGAGLGFYSYDSSYNDWDSSALYLSGRVPIGLSFMLPLPLKLELFLQVVPSLTFYIRTKGDYGNSGMGTNIFGGDLGIRIWL
jgi:hypothetical protein